jgi:hypothetical protein
MGLWLEAACKCNGSVKVCDQRETSSQAPDAELKLFVSVPSLIQAHPSINALSRAKEYPDLISRLRRFPVVLEISKTGS